MKNVLITGGSRGIGRACAKLFADNGYRVFIIYKSNDKAAEIVSKECGAICYKADVCNKEEIEKVVKDIEQKYNHIDVLVNSAGIAGHKLFIDLSSEEWKNMIDINLNGMFNVTCEVTKNMIKNHSGAIVNVSSVWGECGAACEVHYSASKAGIIGLTKGLAKELSMSNIRVNCVTPGAIDTDMNKNLTDDDIKALCEEIPMGRMGKPEEIAELIYFLSCEKSSYITGQVVGINGGWVI